MEGYAVSLNTFQVLLLMISFALLVVAIMDYHDDK